MKSFKLTINEEEIIAASDRIVSVFIGAGNLPQDNYIHIGGMDSDSYNLTWLDRRLEIGDRIKVEVYETNRISSLKERTPSDRNELKVKYYNLKKELEEKGLI
ncbi:hypothetical protein [uncultured Proteiniphilum sp.]|uniref:hypothetical protein n=1 Tax=uncultured Proteiniphilum sp. TaxID=497637 RepID=UPI002613BC02|nr:hypothetical protein [uncultured Proteiniphilum sp.]